MCQSMVNIQSPTAEIRRGKKKKKEERRKKKEERRNRMKIYVVSLLHRATIISKNITKAQVNYKQLQCVSSNSLHDSDL